MIAPGVIVETITKDAAEPKPSNQPLLENQSKLENQLLIAGEDQNGLITAICSSKKIRNFQFVDPSRVTIKQLFQLTISNSDVDKTRILKN
jgi:hypothetical protein